ncbi:probable E3 ubiquitin-protein ligase RHY1A [Phragmites australis]|uniref:probable E3 ubiquitin-protein ligase RHY1A n=1 Tax=Phragmites australis TaxID=29695 RepID=UPI002D788331|nr:probable E3 ubiquitin-protein ligase RHY1A [Phragmites australis]
MPIASKLLYFQRRPSPAPPEPEPEPPDLRRRLSRDASGRQRRRSSLSSSHHKTVQELVPGSQRDAAKSVGSTGNITEHVGCMVSRARLDHSVSDHGRLPDAVQQARERLLQRLNSVDLSGRRHNTWSSETISAGLTRPIDLGILTSADSILGSLTNCFQPGSSIATCKAQESVVEPVSNEERFTTTTMFSEPDPELQHSAWGGAEEGEGTSEPSAECSICLERCGGADGLTQLHCKHVFHSACLERWLQSRGDCPYCRASVLLTTD